jgi:4-azaleucine resistance transporter AzlC
MIPLYAGVIPFGLAYAVTARSAGLSLFDTQLMSLAVFAGASQFSGAGLFAIGAGWLTLVLTTFVINVRHLLYSLTLSQRVQASWPQRLLAAHLLTDEAFGIFIVSGRRDLPFLLGTSTSLFTVWNLSTLVGALASGLVADPGAAGIDFIFPLAFLALLIPLLERPLDLAIAALCGLASLWLGRVFDTGVAILLIGVVGSLLGAILTRDTPPRTGEEGA